jgi:hypothetical protein
VGPSRGSSSRRSVSMTPVQLATDSAKSNTVAVSSLYMMAAKRASAGARRWIRSIACAAAVCTMAWVPQPSAPDACFDVWSRKTTSARFSRHVVVEVVLVVVVGVVMAVVVVFVVSVVVAVVVVVVAVVVAVLMVVVVVVVFVMVAAVVAAMVEVVVGRGAVTAVVFAAPLSSVAPAAVL